MSSHVLPFEVYKKIKATATKFQDKYARYLKAEPKASAVDIREQAQYMMYGQTNNIQHRMYRRDGSVARPGSDAFMNLIGFEEAELGSDQFRA
jgi:hypothetical protein